MPMGIYMYFVQMVAMILHSKHNYADLHCMHNFPQY